MNYARLMRLTLPAIALFVAIAAGGCLTATKQPATRKSVDQILSDAEKQRVDFTAQKPSLPLKNQNIGRQIASHEQEVRRQRKKRNNRNRETPIPFPPLHPEFRQISYEEELPPPLNGRRGDLVSDSFVEADIRQALNSLAAQAGVSVVIDDAVSGAANGVFENEPFEYVLRKLLLPLGCVYRRQGNEFVVGLPDPDSAMFYLLAQRRDYRTVHRSPAELKEMLPERLRRFVRIGEYGNLIIIDAPPELGDQVEEELRLSDTRPPQVIIEAMVCVYSPEAGFRFSFDLDHGVQLTSHAVGSALQGLALSGNFGPRTAPNLNNFSQTRAVLTALEQEGYLSIQAAPKITARDGKKAQIQIGRESYFSVQQGPTAAILRNDIKQVESGIMLDILPSIRGDRITVEIERAEVSEDIRTDDIIANASSFPVINRRRVSTTVHVGDGETIVIGGLKQTQRVDQHVQRPILGKIPLLGRLFQRIEKKDQVSEVAIFISPRIVRHGEPIEDPCR